MRTFTVAHALRMVGKILLVRFLLFLFGTYNCVYVGLVAQLMLWQNEAAEGTVCS